VQEAVQLLARQPALSRSKSRTNLSPDCPAVLCDTAQMHQVIMNLGTNAAHAMQSAKVSWRLMSEPVVPDRNPDGTPSPS